MMSARSFGNYDLAGALADLIDNSIAARSKNIRLRCLYNDGNPVVRVLDDGHGMFPKELQDAMRPASTNPAHERAPDDLGRFGWGMKSASFSQCRRLTVISSKDGTSSGAVWDLDDIDGWRMGLLSKQEIEGLASPELKKSDGTEVIWENCDRLSDEGSISQADFNSAVSHACDQLALIFQKYLSGKVRGKKFALTLNGGDIKPFDPFFTEHDATQPLEREAVRIKNSTIKIEPFILPHYSKLKPAELERLGGPEGFVRNQGFYVYRNHRLIISGTWFRLAKHGELSQLVRISVDIPNSLDDIWKITIDKSEAKLPTVLRNRLKQIVDGLRIRSSKVYRRRGGTIGERNTVSVWNRASRDGEIRYFINRDHPLIARLFETTDDDAKVAASAALKSIEVGFPVEAFSADTANQIDSINQAYTSPEDLRSLLRETYPSMLSRAGGDTIQLLKDLKKTEPFTTSWSLVETLLREEGLLNV